MQSNLINRTSAILGTSLRPKCGQLTVQVRHHVKIYPWRRIRTARESYMDNTRTPYTEGHNINEFAKQKRQKKPWMFVTPKEKDNRFNVYHWNPLYRSDPEEAKQFSYGQMKEFEKSLLERGPCRDSIPYDPPSDVSNRVLTLLKSLLIESSTKQSANLEQQSSTTDTTLLSYNLSDSCHLKFQLLSRCIEEFNHDLPTSYLNDIQCVSDVVDYFSRPVRGINSYAAMTRTQEQKLPENLHLISEAIRYDRENDEFFGGHNAMPGLITRVPGLRGSKKYPVLNQDEFQWPDI